MIVIEYIKIYGSIISLFLVLFHKKLELPVWGRFYHCEINYGDLMFGYFISTLICSIIYWPNNTTYAIWFYYATIIVAISTYQMIFLKYKYNLCVIICNILVIAELIIISIYDLYWQWQLSFVIIGLITSMILSILVAVCKFYIGKYFNTKKEISILWLPPIMLVSYYNILGITPSLITLFN